MISHRAKLIINIITIIALLLLIVFSWKDIQNGLQEIGGANWYILLLMVPLQIFNFFAIGMIYYSFFKSDNDKHLYKNITKRNMLRVALELNFINNVFPSGGVAGFTYLGFRMKNFGVPVARTTLAQSLRFGLTFISFLVLLFIGLFMLSFGAQSSGVTLYIGLSIAFITLFGTLLVVYIVSDESRIKAFTAFLPKLVNNIAKIFKRNKPAVNERKVEKLFSELHKDYVQLMKHRTRLKQPFLWALAVNISEVLTIYLAYLALGQVINPGAVILAYSVASFAGLISILPGGIGVYETLMTATLASAGVPKALALSATLIYRIFTMIIFVPTGFILYQMALKKGQAKEIERVKTSTTKPN